MRKSATRIRGLSTGPVGSVESAHEALDPHVHHLFGMAELAQSREERHAVAALRIHDRQNAARSRVLCAAKPLRDFELS